MVKKSVKICYIAVDVAIPHYRGASTHVYEVAKFLTQIGHKVHVISRRNNRTQPNYEILEGIHVHRIFRGIITPLPYSSYQRLERRGKPPGLLDKLYEEYLFKIYPLYAGLITSQVIKKHGIEVMIERETSFGAGAVASTITGKPMILEIIGPRYSKNSFKKSKKILAYTTAMIREPVPHKKLILVSAIVDVKNFRPNPAEGKIVRERYGLQNLTVIGYIGTFAAWHGIEELIDASEKVLKRFPSVRFLMVGPYFEDAKELTEKRGLSNAYEFTGAVPHSDVPKYINAADILIAPYNPAKSELRRRYGIGSPLKVFEYMACGKPVITTSVEPITQTIQNKKTGILVPSGNSKALSEAIIHLIEKQKLAQTIGKAARKEVEKHYSGEAFAKQLEIILKEAIESHKQ